MLLSDLLCSIRPRTIIGTTEIAIDGIAIDSRQVQHNFLFIAQQGTQVDGHAFIPQAIAAGATAIVHDKPIDDHVTGVTYIYVSSSDSAVGQIATAFYGNPSAHLHLVGVTGTNGKTTIATLLYHLFRRLGHRCGLLSTVENRIEEQILPTEHTTPDPIQLNRLLHEMVLAQCDYAFMECSSHAIDQQRIGGLTFAGGIFTNLTRDHIDYHRTFDNYLRAKKKFFDDLPPTAFAITNADDKNGLIMTQNSRATVKTYSLCRAADYKASIIETHFEGMYLNIDGHEVGVQFIGKFNVSNLLAVYATAVELKKAPQDILLALSTLTPVRGRLQYLRKNDITAVVDYAHTPDAITNVAQTLRDVMKGQGQLIIVCGCGGNRDKGKRPIMAQEAVKAADKVILTSDNPRKEDPEEILNDMMAGLTTPQQLAKVLRITDRRQAIRTAIALAQPHDVVLIAGKGHEDYQIIGTTKHHFDDIEELAIALNMISTPLRG